MQKRKSLLQNKWKKEISNYLIYLDILLFDLWMNNEA